TRTQVSIHAPAWGATCRWTARSARTRCFNPRARMGRDLRAMETTVLRFMFQSTRPHGARPRGINQSHELRVFQSTRPHGARPASARLAHRLLARFNPRARMGRDAVSIYGEQDLDVSIHAPAWGATCCSLRPMRPSASFNPRARMGRDSRLRRHP